MSWASWELTDAQRFNTPFSLAQALKTATNGALSLARTMTKMTPTGLSGNRLLLDSL
jgi:hypothetical protein